MRVFNVNGRALEFSKDIRENAPIRGSFNELAHKTFGLSFEDWYHLGYWGDQYIPYVLIDDNKVVANVSVNTIDFSHRGKNLRYVQLGTVMTDGAYRNMGLSRFLMDRVLEDWTLNCDDIYLFANDSVLDFYPKFGFERAEEYQYSKAILNSGGDAYRLDMSNADDRSMVLDCYEKSNPFSAFSMENNGSLVMFYCTKFMRESVYYSPSEDAVIIAEFDEGTLYVHDVFCTPGHSMDDVISQLPDMGYERLVLGFTPRECEGLSSSLFAEEDTTLFVLKSKNSVLKSDRLMFPTLSHA